MNVTIKIEGDVHIHCDCCDGSGVYADDFEEALEAPHEDLPETEDGGGEISLSAEEAEAVVKAVAELLFPLFQAENDA